MGYSYGYTSSGRQALACDGCGTVGGVRKRACPHRVLGDSLRSTRRVSMSYCYPPALCAVCYQREGGIKGVHPARCAEGAAASQAKCDAIEAALDAGESFVVAAFGDWHEDVPAGMTGLLFKGRTGEVTVMVPKGDYDRDTKQRLSDYPQAQPLVMGGHLSKEVAA